MIEINTYASREHVREIEVDILLVKQIGREIGDTVPYKILPNQIIIHLV